MERFAPGLLAATCGSIVVEVEIGMGTGVARAVSVAVSAGGGCCGDAWVSSGRGVPGALVVAGWCLVAAGGGEESVTERIS